MTKKRYSLWALWASLTSSFTPFGRSSCLTHIDDHTVGHIVNLHVLHLVLVHLHAGYLLCHLVGHLIDHLVDQLVNHHTRHHVGHFVNYHVSHLVGHLVNHHVSHLVGHLVNHLVDHLVGHLVCHLVDLHAIWYNHISNNGVCWMG